MIIPAPVSIAVTTNPPRAHPLTMDGRPATIAFAALLELDAALLPEDEPELPVPVGKDVTVPVPEVPACARSAEHEADVDPDTT